MPKVLVTLTDAQANAIDKMTGKYGSSRSEVLRTLLILKIAGDDEE